MIASTHIRVADRTVTLTPRWWEEIDLAHRAIEAVWDDGEKTSPATATASAGTGSVTS